MSMSMSSFSKYHVVVVSVDEEAGKTECEGQPLV